MGITPSFQYGDLRPSLSRRDVAMSRTCPASGEICRKFPGWGPNSTRSYNPADLFRKFLQLSMAGFNPAIQGNKHRHFRLWMGWGR
jgi:hypothetical protein